MTARDLIDDALASIGVLGAAAVSSGDDADYSLRVLNRLLNRWNADGLQVYTEQAATYTTTGVQPETIGPAGTFVVTPRPPELLAANYVSSDTRTPIAIHDEAWWRGVPTPTLTGSVPTDLAYFPAWPEGRIYFYPALSAGVSIELYTRIALATVELATVITLPAAYEDAIVQSLAEDLAPAFHVPVPPLMSRNAARARALVQRANSRTPYIATTDEASGHGRFDYLTGTSR